LHILECVFLVPLPCGASLGLCRHYCYKPVPIGGVPSNTLAPTARTIWSGCATKALATARSPVGRAYTAQAMIMTDRDNNQITAFSSRGDDAGAPNRVEPDPVITLGIILA
jgi:adenosine kinase